MIFYTTVSLEPVVIQYSTHYTGVMWKSEASIAKTLKTDISANYFFLSKVKLDIYLVTNSGFNMKNMPDTIIYVDMCYYILKCLKGRH